MKKLLLCGILAMLAACKKEDVADASGTFEAVETMVPAQASGIIERFDVEEGQELKAGQTIGQIDTTDTYLQWRQVRAQMKSASARKPDVPVELAALREQLRKAVTERTRVANLLAGGAATQKQLDDADTEVAVIRKKIDAQQSTLDASAKGIDNDVLALEAKRAMLEDQLGKSEIVNPVGGTVLAKYAEEKEMASPGKPLYKIADLSEIILRAYVTGNQLPKIRLNQQVRVLTDNGDGGMRETPGKITWISDKAEFTPKTIQTKDERANMVYAVKVSVRNDGTYKIGMYGEIRL